MIGLKAQPAAFPVTLQRGPAGLPAASPIQKSKPCGQQMVKQQGLAVFTLAVQPPGTALMDATKAAVRAAQPPPAGTGGTTARLCRPPLEMIPQLQPTPFDTPATQKVWVLGPCWAKRFPLTASTSARVRNAVFFISMTPFSVGRVTRLFALLL